MLLYYFCFSEKNLYWSTYYLLPFKYKLALIKTLIDIAYKINNTILPRVFEMM